MHAVGEIQDILVRKELPFHVGYGGVTNIDFHIPTSKDPELTIEVRSGKIYIEGEEVDLDYIRNNVEG